MSGLPSCNSKKKVKINWIRSGCYGTIGVGKRMNFIKILLQALIYTTILLIPFAWILRDGLGPDSRTSSGFNAISKCFMTFYSGPILIGLLALSFWVKKKNGPDK